jgi:hypothetical protein
MKKLYPSFLFLLFFAFLIPHEVKAQASLTWSSGANWTTTSAWSGTTWPTTTPFANATFNSNASLNFATSTVGSVTVNPGFTVTVTAGGTLSFIGGAVQTWTVGSGGLLTWQSQTILTNVFISP